MDVQPASIAQVRTGKDGKPITIDADVGGVAAQLREIDPKLKLAWNEKGGFFYVAEDDGREERLVFTAQECDGRIVERARQIASESYDLVAEMDRLDRGVERERDHAFSEKLGEAGERAAHALRKDLGATNKAFVGKDVPDGA